MGIVTKFYPKGSGKNPDKVLEQAIGEYSELLILGWDKEDKFDFRATTELTHEQILWIVSVFQRKLLNGDYDSE